MDHLLVPQVWADAASGTASKFRLCSADPAAFKSAAVGPRADAVRAHLIDLWSPCTSLEVHPGKERVSDLARFSATDRRIVNGRPYASVLLVSRAGATEYCRRSGWRQVAAGSFQCS